MQRFITVFGGAVLAVLTAWPAAAQEGRQLQLHHMQHGVWIGAMCVPVDEALRAQLQIDDGVGLVVAEIVPESPAAKAGLKRFDVVTGIDGTPLKNVGELMAAVDGADDQPLKLDLYRGGKRQTVEVQPGERPRGDVLKRFNVPFNEGRLPPQDPEQMREWVEKMRQNLPEGEAKRMQEWAERMQRGEAQPFRMQMFGPGIVVHHRVGGGALPQGVSVTIKKNGDKPADIHVERGDETWDVKENELDKLPADLRGPVGGVFGGGAHGVMLSTPEGAAAAAVAGDSGEAGIKIGIQPDVRVETRTFTIPTPPSGGMRAMPELEGLKTQVEQLQRQVDELKKSLPASPPAKEPATKKTKT